MARARPDAVTQAVRLLAGRERTQAELVAGLEARGYAPDEVAGAVARARALGYLDEVAVAQRRAAAALDDGWAPEAALARLLAGGVDEATARGAVAAAQAEAGWEAVGAARRLLARKGHRGPRAARLLVSRGFDEGVIARVVGREAPEED